MTSTFSVATARDLRRKKYLPVHTTFYTEDGPALNSIWFDVDDKLGRKTFMVSELTDQGNIIHYAEGGWDWLHQFDQRAASGRYVLVGVMPEQFSHVEC